MDVVEERRVVNDVDGGLILHQGPKLVDLAVRLF